MLTTEIILVSPEVQAQAHRVHAWLQIPHENDYEDQAEAMDHAYSIASRTKHRMEVRPNRFGRWCIRLGKGPLQ
jgi:hypothetical protein